MSDRCYIIPPHLLQAIADSTSNSDGTRQSAKSSLANRERVSLSRKERFAALTMPRGYKQGAHAPEVARQNIISESMLNHLATSDSVDEATRSRAKKDLDHLQKVIAKLKEVQQGGRQQVQSLTAQEDTDDSKDAPYRAVYDAQNTSSESGLPGKLVRAEGEPAVKDKTVNEAFDNVGAVLEFYKEHFKWKSIDNRNADVISSVHFGEAYENAFWDPQERQMVFGDGGEFLNNFTGCIDVIGHELTHAVTEHTSPLDYQGQPGALNEHVSDVFGIMVKQKVQDETADKADWLVGEDCILPGVKGVALRSMKAPGTAYDDPRFGKDPQVENMSEFTDMYEDNGGVHIFSGIPNKAFYLAAIAFGGYSWEKAGQIWWKTLNSGQIPARCNFQQFADATVDCAKEELGDEAAKIVRKAWTDVGVTRSV